MGASVGNDFSQNPDMLHMYICQVKARNCYTFALLYNCLTCSYANYIIVNRMNANTNVIFYIRRLVKLFDKEFNTKLNQYDLTAQQGRAVFFVVRRYKDDIETNQHHLEKQFELSKSTVSGLIKRLKTNGFITIESSSTKNIISPTEKAICLENTFIKLREETLKKVLDGIPKEDEEKMYELLKIMIRNMEES